MRNGRLYDSARRLHHAIVSRFSRPFLARRRVASRYLHGTGVEIGALHLPLPVKSGTNVHYVDRAPTSELRRLYPELRHLRLVDVHIVDDGNSLMTLVDQSQDFVIASHVIEHCENPIAALSNWLRVVRREGIVYLGVPDKRRTFDRDRPLTSMEHVLRDFADGPAWSRISHYEEAAKFYEKLEGDAAREWAIRQADIRADLHFHVWTRDTFVELLNYCRAVLHLPFEVVEVIELRTGIEFIVILRRTGGGAAGTATSVQRAGSAAVFAASRQRSASP